MTTPVGNEEELSHKLIAMFDQLFGLHPGFRPAHAKGMMCVGTFKATPAAAELTKAPHAAGGEIKVNVRFSNSTGVPLIPDTDPNASPRGIGIRFSPCRTRSHRHRGSFHEWLSDAHGR